MLICPLVNRRCSDFIEEERELRESLKEYAISRIALHQ
jgi:hypothetical protein